MAVRGFRAKIGLHVVLLLLVSALVTDVLVMVIVQGGMVREHLNTQYGLIYTLGRMVIERPATANATPQQPVSLGGIEFFVEKHWSLVQVVDAEKRILYQKSGPEETMAIVQAAINSAERLGKMQMQNIGMTWAVYWWQPRETVIALPISIDGRLRGTVSAAVPLTPLYARLRQYNRPVYYYIFFNTVVLAFIGLYRIFRIYLRPIDRIVRQADDYGRAEDIFFTFRQEDDELNRLSSSLNRMLKRISADKEKLTQTVEGLEKANKELRHAQSEIIRAEKLASVGRLAAGIAHEIGNPIGIVLGYLDLLKQNDIDAADREAFLSRSETEIQRINTVIRQLLDLARPKADAFGDVSVHDVIEEVVEMMAHQPMMADIQLKLSLNAEKYRLPANADQLHQVFLNLMLNAVDAIRSTDRGSEGEVLINTTMDHRSEGQEVGQWLTIDVQDNGHGIAADQLETIFDPFYTTKEPGKGTGLGLAVSFMIIDKMGGTILAKSTPGQGTTMTIRLPIDAGDNGLDGKVSAVDVKHDEEGENHDI